MDKFEIAKGRISIDEILQNFGIQINRGGFIYCPSHNETTPSCKVYKRNVKCFSCGFNGSVIDITMILMNCDKYEALSYLDKAFNLGLETPLTDEQRKDWGGKQRKKEIEIQNAKLIDKKTAEKIKKNQLEIVKYVEKCRQNVSLTDYWSKRGIANNMVKRFNLGYDIERKCVVIPYNRANNYYQSRNVLEKKYFKPSTTYAGAEPIYNASALNTENDCCFIVESPINAISIMQCGGTSVAICGVSNVNKLIKYIKENSLRCKKLLISFDNDEAGLTASIKLSNLLEELKIDNEIVNISDDENDVNDLLKKNQEKLKENIIKIAKTLDIVKQA